MGPGVLPLFLSEELGPKARLACKGAGARVGRQRVTEPWGWPEDSRLGQEGTQQSSPHCSETEGKGRGLASGPTQEGPTT